MKKYLSLLLLIFFLSCRDDSNITILDEYFVSMLNIDIDKIQGEIKVIDFTDFNMESLHKYDKIYLSPLIYEFNRDDIESLNTDVFILYRSINSNKAYIQLFENLREMEGIKNISVVINEDSYNKNIKLLEDMKTLFELSILLIVPTTEQNDINSFIVDNSKTDLWVIDSEKFDYFLYDKLSVNKIVLREGLNISDINDNVLYSLYTDVNQNIYGAAKNDSYLIELKLKKN